MNNLKPCPFCGSPSVYLCRDNQGAFVSCPVCHIHVHFYGLEWKYSMGLNQTAEENKAAVVEAWGKRVNE